jgi:hypothetical protein
MSANTLFDPETLIAEAEQELGLSDWGGEEFREPLKRISVSAAGEAYLTPAGELHLMNRIRTLLRNRLRMIADRGRLSGIVEQQIVRPIFITGLPRAGTTHTHALLSQDPGSRSPRLWEILDPSPPAACDELNRGVRLNQVQSELEKMGFSSPELKHIHQTDASTAEEDGFIFEHTFASRNFAAFWRMPSFMDYVNDEVDQTQVFDYHRKFLQSAQHGCPRDRWVLKSPPHLYFMEALLAVYPDAIVIQNHRDPARIIPSISNFYVKLRELFSHRVDPAEIADFHLHNWLEGLERCDAVRRKPEFKDRFYDIHYLDIAREPLKTIEAFYAHFDLPLSDDTHRRMNAYVEAREREGHGTDYTLADYSLQEGRIDEMYAGYMQRYGVEREKRR